VFRVLRLGFSVLGSGASSRALPEASQPRGLGLGSWGQPRGFRLGPHGLGF
jgi:hypothetical protein